jgi:hypothetical protein
MVREKRLQLNSIAYGVIILTITTAVIHLYLSSQFPNGPDPAFMLNGIGYFVLLAAIYAPLPILARHRSLFCWLLIAYTALTIVLWLFFGANSWIAYIDKTGEVALVLLLWAETRRFSA